VADRNWIRAGLSFPAGLFGVMNRDLGSMLSVENIGTAWALA